MFIGLRLVVEKRKERYLSAMKSEKKNKKKLDLILSFYSLFILYEKKTKFAKKTKSGISKISERLSTIRLLTKVKCYILKPKEVIV